MWNVGTIEYNNYIFKGVVPHNPGSQIERQFVCAVKSPPKELSFFRGVKSDSVLTFSPSILSVCEGAGGD